MEQVYWWCSAGKSVDEKHKSEKHPTKTRSYMYQNSSFFKYLSLMSEYITFSEKQNFIMKTTNERKDTDKRFFSNLIMV